MQIVEDMLRQSRIEVAWTSEGHYVTRIDLAGRLGRFALPFALGRTCSYLSPKIERRCSALAAQLASLAKGLPHEYGCGEMVQ